MLRAAGTGRLWQGPVSDAITAPTWSATLELWRPYWPFEPFLPLALFGCAAWFLAPVETAGTAATRAPRSLA